MAQPSLLVYEFMHTRVCVILRFGKARWMSKRESAHVADVLMRV